MRRIAIAAVVFMTGCGTPSPDDSACSTEARSGITVMVKNATGGAAICGATVIIRDGTFTETLQELGPDCSYAGAWERAGLYRLEVSKTGFNPASEDNIKVTKDECHVKTEIRTVTLTPL